MPKVIAIHDLSLWSKSSLSVALPLLEAMGHEVFSLPTTILSTQSDGFPSLIESDMSSLLIPFYEKVKSYGYSFDAVYTGYLGNARIATSVKEIIERENAFTLIDPVLGDNGELYQSMRQENIHVIRDLLKHANVITPNITEASLITERQIEKTYSNKKLRELIKSLEAIGPEKGTITSVPLEIGKLANVAYDKDDIRIFSYDDLEVSYPGSGDLFATLFLSFLLSGNSFFPSVKASGEITTRAVSYAKETGRERRMGISLSPVMNDIRSLV